MGEWCVFFWENSLMDFISFQKLVQKESHQQWEVTSNVVVVGGVLEAYRPEKGEGDKQVRAWGP